ncbi:MAG: PAS domain S-box protein, partial [Bacteroidales bacterium]
MKIKQIQNFLFGTLRGRLIISVALVHAVMMTLFIVDLSYRHRAMLLNQQLEEADALTHALSTSAAGWIAANDIAGLQELVDAQIRYPELFFAILTDQNGQILAHTDRNKIGQFLLDLPKKDQRTIINKSIGLVDVINPVILSGKHVGWARIGLGQKVSDKKLQSIVNDGILYALLAILVGALIAWFMGRRITRRLYAVQDTMNLISAGDHSARAALSGTDEPAVLANQFNAMLDALDESGARFKKLFNAASVPHCFVNSDGVIGEYNHRFEQTFGYTHKEIPTIDEWWQLAYPDPEYRQKVITLWQLAVKRSSDHNTDIEPAEHMLNCKNGEVRTMLISGSLIGDSILASFIDITERKQAENLLRESELKYRQLIESLNEGIWMIDEKAVTTFANPIMAEMLGYTVEEMLGRHLFSFMDEQGTQIASRNLERRQQGFRENHEFEFIRKNGVRIYTSLETGPVTDVDGNYRGAVAGVIDITQRRQAEVALRESELKYRSLIEASSDAIFCVDENGQYQFTNQLFASTFGQSPDYFIGKTFWDIYPKEHADY